jgi:hypothetical protein
MPSRRRSQRIQPYIAREVRERLTRHCAGLGVTESGVVNEAIVQYLDGTADAALLMRRQDRLDRGVQRLTRDLELLSQTIGVFLRVWLAHSPPLPKEARGAALASAEHRYRQILDRVAAQFTGGKRFVDDLPQDYFAHEGELAAERPSEDPDPGPETPPEQGGSER